MDGREWETCSRQAGCGGAALAPSGSCLAHLDPEQELRQALGGLAAGTGVDARGVTFDERLLGDVLDSAPRTPDGKARLDRVDFSLASFDPGTRFDGVAFGNETRFDGAIFATRATFADATFGDRTSFRRVVFRGSTRFDRCTFGNRVAFSNASFGDGARFHATRFGELASFADTTWGDDASFASATFGRRMRADRAVFGEGASFRNAVFAREASLRTTRFAAGPSFEGASFGGEASFSGSTFGDSANFAGTSYTPGISFRRATFGRLATFRRATFGDRAWFTDATFGRGVSFANATFEGRTRFNQTTFAERADFAETIFCGQVTFERATFDERASFRLATFERARSFGPVVVFGLLSLDQASFLEAVRVEVAAQRLRASRARFPEGGELRVRWAEIALDEADFGAPAILTGAERFASLDNELRSRLDLDSPRPQLVSVRGANVAELTLSGVDVSGCRFVGAHNLERLRIEGDSPFAQSPAWTSRRRVIAEEREWRARRRRRWPTWGAPPAFAFATEGVGKPSVLSPDRIAAIYRDLRRGRESNGDAPGAADFYFGEMEMRRLDPTRPRSERALIWLYWLVSGYALRGLRAVAALLLTIVVFALLLQRFGFEPRVGLRRALLFSAESTSNLFRVPATRGATLTETGELLQMGLRVLGPLFFALALLSVRGRVRR